MKKKLLVLPMLLAIVSTGCNGTIGGGTTKEYVEEGATKITIYTREFESWSKAHLKDLVNRFNSDLTDGIQVSVNFYTQANYATALTVARENGRAPDLYISTYAELYNSHIQGNHAAPLEEYLSADQKADIVPQYLEMVTFGEHIYAYPWNLEPGSMLFYRKDMLERAGVTSVPKSWAELYEACNKLVSSRVVGRGQYACGLPLGSAECTWVTYGMQQNTTGGLLLEDDWRTLRLNKAPSDQGFKDIAQFFYNMYSNDYSQTGGLTSEGYTYIVDALCDDTLAMTFSGSWGFAEIFDYTKSDMDIVNKIGVAPIPTIDGNQTGCTSANGGWCYAMSQESKHKDMAAKFLNWMLMEDANRTAEYFVKAYHSKAAPTYSVQNVLKNSELNVPKNWYDTCNDVASKGIPEATYPWDVAAEYGKMLETMELNCKKGDFESLYAAALNTAVNNINTIMQRASYPNNPKQ